ncbi:MAG: indole-3-glycerol phosphate synthase TrpC [Bacteroidales bacterium]|jgi:indole-3-glycerol phosphate synthase
MMNILEKIMAHKQMEVASAKEIVPVSVLEQSPFFNRSTLSLTGYLLRPGSSGIIAEFKRKSPSRGIINSKAQVEMVTAGYLKAGSAALSVLTDRDFFGGSHEDLSRARKTNDCPILRKDFIVDPYQVIEAKSIGADAILLIASILTPRQVLDLARLARSLGLETILEVHGYPELTHLNDQISILGVNNRNLGDFSVSLDISLSMSGFITEGIPAISESGIHEPADLVLLKQAGFSGFLIGEQFMSSEDPGLACKSFISKVKRISV